MISLQRCFFLFSILGSFAVEGYAQLADYQFRPLSYQIIQQVDQGNFDTAEQLLEQWDITGQALSGAALAEYNFIQGYYTLLSTGEENSFSFFTEAGKTYDSLGWEAHRYLCDVYIVINLYVKARWEEAKHKGEALLLEIPEDQLEARALLHNTLGASYSGHDMDYTKASFHNRKALAYFLAQKNHRRLVSVYGILAACENNLKRFERAITYIDSAQYFAQQINNEQQIAFLRIRKFRVLFAQKKYEEAFATIKTAEQYFEDHPTEQGQLGWVYGISSLAYAEIKDYKNAYDYSVKRHLSKGEERAKKNDERISELMVQYETDKKEQQIKMQSLIIENERQRSQQLIFGSIGFLSFLTLLFALGYVYYRNKQQENLRRTQLQYQKQLLESTINTQEAERKRISQDLHDGIGQQLSGLKFSFRQLSEQMTRQVPQQKKQLDKLENVINEASTDVRNLSHQMMPKALQEFGLVPALADLLDKTFSMVDISYEFHHHGLEERMVESVEIGLYRIAQELINNILKHSGAKEVNFQLLKNKKHLMMMVEDDGRGFDLSQIKTQGHGLTNIRSRLQAINGEVNFEAMTEGGTLVTVRVPFSNNGQFQ